MNWRRFLRLVPAALVAACSAGDLVLPPPPAGASATPLLNAILVTWTPVDGADGYVVLVDGSASFANPTAFENAVSPLTVDVPTAAPRHFRILARRNGFLSPASAVLSVAPIPVGTSGLVPLDAVAWTVSNGDPTAHFGFPVSPAGDVDEDGFDDLLVGCMFTSAGGTAFLYRGNPAGLVVQPAWERASTQTGAHFAKGLSSPGDVNGDGFRDVLVGSAEYDDAFSNEGRAWVFPGTGDASFFADTEIWSVDGAQTNVFTGRFTAPAGDVNGDGLDDFAMSFHALDAPSVNEGRVCVWHGAPGAPSVVADFCDEPDQSDAWLSYALSPARGDADGDGYDDLLVGAYQWDEGATTDAGAAFLYRGGPAGLEGQPSWTLPGETTNDELGGSLSFAGDVNGDGFDDAIVGASHFGADDRGRAYLHLGSRSGLSMTEAWTYDGTSGDELGMGVGAAGDVNADGFDDVLVGAHAADAGGDDAGRVALFLGGPSGLAATPSWEWFAGDAGGFSGGSLSTAGDVNGDGSGDVAVGTVSYENYNVVNGKARVFLGPPREGPRVTLDGASLAGSFTDVAAQGTATCTWDWGDGTAPDVIAPCSPADAGGPTHSYAGSGAFLVRLRVENAYGVAGEAFATARSP